MKVAYIPYHSKIEDEILIAFKRRNGTEISVQNDILILPLILNVTKEPLEKLKEVLGREYKHITDKLSETSVQFVFQVSQSVSRAKKGGLDILVIYYKDQDISDLSAVIRKRAKK